MPSPSHQLFWLIPGRNSVSELIQEGFNWIDCSAGWGEPNVHWLGLERTSFEQYCQLLPVSADHWLTKAIPGFFPTPMYQDGWDHLAPETFFTHTGQLALDRAELSDWYLKVFLEFDGTIRTELQNALFNPHLLIRLGYQLAQAAAQKEGVKSTRFQAAMAAVGTGCRGIELWVCNLCFRRCRGELRVCDLHSQSKVVLDLSNTERSHQFQRARVTQKAARAIDSKAIPTRKINGYWELDTYEFELQVGGILWPLVGFSHRDWLEQVLHALSAAPLVSSRLSKSFIHEHNHSQIEQLQQAVGSREWLVSRWPTLIPLAEAWLQAEKIAAPGAPAPGLTEKNRQRVELANVLLAKGVKHSQIAEQLGISRSHLSHLLSRAAGNLAI